MKTLGRNCAEINNCALAAAEKKSKEVKAMLQRSTARNLFDVQPITEYRPGLSPR